jgi:HSP20 family protein
MIKVVGAAGLERLELKRLTERVARLFAALQEAVEAETPATVGSWAPPADISENAEKICVRMELPGVSADQIKIGLTSSQLRISGEKRPIKSRQRKVSHVCSERSYGRFNRIMPIRWPICVKDARAELSNGLLVIHIPKIADRRGAEFRVPIKETRAKKQPS